MTSFKSTKVADDLLREAHAKAMFDSTTTGTSSIGGAPTAGDTWWDDFETTTRRFVSDLPWWERFLIWLFPRMYDIREYKPWE